MTKAKKELNPMILKLCEDLVPKTKMADDSRMAAAIIR
jgi:hypothetical protein